MTNRKFVLSLSNSFLLLLLLIFLPTPTVFQGVLYLGQESPENEPKVFAPGFISLPGRFEFTGSFSPDGTELYFTASHTDHPEDNILLAKLADGVWTSPAELGVYQMNEGVHDVARRGDSVFAVPFHGLAILKVLRVQNPDVNID